MQKNSESKSIEQLMAEADELIRQIHSGAINDMEEEHRIQFEKHAQDLKRIRTEIQDKIDRETASEKASEIGSGAEGTHEAIQEIVKAMNTLKKYLS